MKIKWNWNMIFKNKKKVYEKITFIPSLRFYIPNMAWR